MTMDYFTIAWLSVCLIMMAVLASTEIVMVLKQPPRRFSLRILLFSFSVAAFGLACIGVVRHFVNHVGR
jgi:hypothetical protein